MAAVLLRQQSRDQLWIVIVAKLPLEMTTTGTRQGQARRHLLFSARRTRQTSIDSTSVRGVRWINSVEAEAMQSKRLVERVVGNAFPGLRDYIRLCRGFYISLGHFPNVLNPKTFSEKIQRRKLFDRDARLPLRADKIAVKYFVQQKLGSDWITPTLWFGTKLPDKCDWPIPFVIKASHGSAMNYFVRNEQELKWPEIENLCCKWLQDRYYGPWGGEWLYSQIEPRLLVEPFIGDLAALPVDYKLWTFHGRVEFIQVDTDREHAHKRTMFDREWWRLPFTTGYPVDEREIARPRHLNEIVRAAEALAEDFAFVRVDFYDLPSGPRFGEMTFYPDSGLAQFSPAEYDFEIGSLWR